MRYKEIIDRYKKGLASEEEKQTIEREIEKYEAIEEYLADVIDMKFNDLNNSMENEQHEETVKFKKSVDSRLRKVVFTSVAIVIALITGIFFIISPLVDNLYYNPSKVTVGAANKDINFDLYAFSELNIPGYSLKSNVGVDRLGFGEYDISFFRRNLFTQDTDHISTKIKRGEKVTNYSEIIWNSNSNFLSVRHPTAISPEFVAVQKEKCMNHLKQLNPIAYVSSNITFERDLTMEELYEFELKYPEINFVWAGIRIPEIRTPDNKQIASLIGIHLINSNSMPVTDSIVEEKYPAFDISKWLGNLAAGGGEMPPVAEAYELHYKSLLKYMTERKEAVNILDFSVKKLEFYELALDYADKYGVKTYGVLIYANAQDLIELAENELIKTLEINEVMASKKHIK